MAVDPFHEEPLPLAHYHPSPPRRHKHRQTHIGSGSVQTVADALCGENFLLRNDDLDAAYRLLSVEEASREQASPAFNESWPASERPSSPSFSEAGSLTMLEIKKVPVSRENLPATHSAPNVNTPHASPSDSVVRSTRDHFEVDGLSSEEPCLKSDKKSASTLSKYIDRFRNGMPLCREERNRMQATDAKDFWWLGPCPRMESTAPSISTAKQATARTSGNLHRTVSQSNSNKAALTAQNIMLAGLSSGSINPWQLDADLQKLQDRADQLLEETVSCMASSEPVISTVGLGSQNDSTLSEDTAKAGNRPATRGTSACPAVKRPSRREEDILYQWRFKRKLESSQNRMSMSAGSRTKLAIVKHVPGPYNEQDSRTSSQQHYPFNTEGQLCRPNQTDNKLNNETKPSYCDKCDRDDLVISKGLEQYASNEHLALSLQKDSDSSFEELKSQHIQNLKSAEMSDRLMAGGDEKISAMAKGNNIEFIEAEKDENYSDFNSTKAQHRVPSSRHQTEDRVQSNGHQSEDRVQSNRHQPEDTIQSNRHQPEDRVQSNRHQPEDRIKHQSEDRVQSNRHQPEDRVQSNRHQPEDRVQSNRHQPEDRVQSNRHQPEDRITHQTKDRVQSNRHQPEDRVQSNRCQPEDRFQSISHDPEDGEHQLQEDKVQPDCHQPLENNDHSSRHQTTKEGIQCCKNQPTKNDAKCVATEDGSIQHQNKAGNSRSKGSRKLIQRRSKMTSPRCQSSPVRPLSHAIGQVVMEHLLSSSLSLTESEISVYGSVDDLVAGSEMEMSLTGPGNVKQSTCPTHRPDRTGLDTQQTDSIKRTLKLCTDSEVLLLSEEEDFKDDDLLQDLRSRRQQLLQKLAQLDVI